MRLSKDENVARGYAVFTPNGRYVKPSCMNASMKSLVDTGYVKVDEWGHAFTTDKFDSDIKAIAKPELKPVSTASGFDKLLESLDVDEINNLSNKIKMNYPQNAVTWFLEDKPAELLALEAQLQAKLDAYWTPERKAIAKANERAQYEYETAIIRIEQKRSDINTKIEKAEGYVARAIERKNNPVLAATQDKIAAIIEDKKRSTSEKTVAIFEKSTSAGASHNAKREIVLAIASLLGKGYDKDSIFASISNMVEFTALAYKRPEKEFNRLYKDTVSWIHYKNQIKSFYDLLGWTYEGLNNTRIQKDTKTQLPVILSMIALHQAKDNDSRGLVAFRYLTRITVVSSPLFNLDPTKVGRKLEAYAKQEYITYAKGQQGGISSRAGLMPYHKELTPEQLIESKTAILSSFEGSPFYGQMKVVLDLIQGKPAYNDQDLENAVAALLDIFVPLTRIAADERIAERQLESVDFEASREAYLKEQEEKISRHLASGLGFQPRMKV